MGDSDEQERREASLRANRRDVLRAAVGAVGASAVPATVARGQSPRTQETLLDEGFESYSTGSYPSDWSKEGNSNQQVVDGTAAEGEKSLRIEGSSGGCWEALADAPISLPSSGTVTFSGSVKPTSNGEVGCHDGKRGAVKLRTETGSWSAGKGTRLLYFHTDGTVHGVNGEYGSYDIDEWNSFEVTYERTDTEVTVSYTINGEPRGSATRAVAGFEDDLSYLRLGSGEFTVFYDDLTAETVTTPDGPGVEVRDFTGDGSDDVRVHNSETWLMLEGEHRDTRVYASRLGRAGESSLGNNWDFRPTTRDPDQFKHQSTDGVETFQDGDGAGYHVWRTWDVGGARFEEATTVYLPAGSRTALVRIRLTNESGSSVLLDQDQGNIHDGVMLTRGTVLRDYGSDYRFHATGSGTHQFANAGLWETFGFSGDPAVVTAFDDQNAISYGLVDGASGPRQVVTNGDPVARGDMMVRQVRVSAGDTATYTLAVGAHDGGDGAPSRAANSTASVAGQTSEIPSAGDGGGGGGGGGDSNESPTAELNVSDASVEVGEETVFDASRSSDSDGSVARYEWDFDGDGTTDAAGATVTHTYDEPGRYEVSLTVVDDDGARATATTTVEVEATEQKPSPEFDVSPTNPEVGTEVTFDASQSSDSDGTITSHEWDFDGDGTTDATGETVTHTFSEPGDYTVALTVTDDTGRNAVAVTTLSVTAGEGPTPSFSVSPDGPQAGAEVTFDASASTAPDGSITAYEWNFDGDGTIEATGQTVTRVFEEAGDYTVSLTVTADDGQSASASRQVSVGGELAAARKRKLSTADQVDAASLLSSMDWTGDDLTDRAIAETTIGAWESSLADGAVDRGTAVDAVDRLHAAETATRGVLRHLGPAEDETNLNFTRRLASNATSVLLDLILMKLSIGEKLLSAAPSWVAGAIKNTIGTTLEDGIVGMLGDFIDLEDARVETKEAASSEMDAVWQDIKGGVTDLAGVMADAVDAVVDVVTGAVRASVEFFSITPLALRGPPDGLRDLVMGNSVWAATFDLHDGLRPGAVGGSLPGSTSVATSAAEEGLQTVDRRLEGVAETLDTFSRTVGDISIYDSMKDVIRADSWADIGWELAQSVVDVAVSLAGIVTDATATLAAGLATWQTRKIHAEIVESAVTGENRVEGWTPV